MRGALTGKRESLPVNHVLVGLYAHQLADTPIHVQMHCIFGEFCVRVRLRLRVRLRVRLRLRLRVR